MVPSLKKLMAHRRDQAHKQLQCKVVRSDWEKHWVLGEHRKRHLVQLEGFKESSRSKLSLQWELKFSIKAINSNKNYHLLTMCHVLGTCFTWIISFNPHDNLWSRLLLPSEHGGHWDSKSTLCFSSSYILSVMRHMHFFFWYLNQDSAKFFCKGTDSKYFRLCRYSQLCWNSVKTAREPA